MPVSTLLMAIFGEDFEKTGFSDSSIEMLTLFPGVVSYPPAWTPFFFRQPKEVERATSEDRPKSVTKSAQPIFAQNLG